MNFNIGGTSVTSSSSSSSDDNEINGLSNLQYRAILHILSTNNMIIKYYQNRLSKRRSRRKKSKKIVTARNKARDLSTSAPVVVFSKTDCGYCTRVKQLLTQLAANFKVIELNEETDGVDIQEALAQWTGQRTVPNVFIGGKHIGGCDGTLEKHKKGELLPLLNDAGAIGNNSAQL